MASEGASGERALPGTISRNFCSPDPTVFFSYIKAGHIALYLWNLDQQGLKLQLDYICLFFFSQLSAMEWYLKVIGNDDPSVPASRVPIDFNNVSVTIANKNQPSTKQLLLKIIPTIFGWNDLFGMRIG